MGVSIEEDIGIPPSPESSGLLVLSAFESGRGGACWPGSPVNGFLEAGGSLCCFFCCCSISFFFFFAV
jgi:hypothetical protein